MAGKAGKKNHETTLTPRQEALHQFVDDVMAHGISFGAFAPTVNALVGAGATIADYWSSLWKNAGVQIGQTEAAQLWRRMSVDTVVSSELALLTHKVRELITDPSSGKLNRRAVCEDHILTVLVKGFNPLTLPKSAPDQGEAPARPRAEEAEEEVRFCRSVNLIGALLQYNPGVVSAKLVGGVVSFAKRGKPLTHHRHAISVLQHFERAAEKAGRNIWIEFLRPLESEIGTEKEGARSARVKALEDLLDTISREDHEKAQAARHVLQHLGAARKSYVHGATYGTAGPAAA